MLFELYVAHYLLNLYLIRCEKRQNLVFGALNLSFYFFSLTLVPSFKHKNGKVQKRRYPSRARVPLSFSVLFSHGWVLFHMATYSVDNHRAKYSLVR